MLDKSQTQDRTAHQTDQTSSRKTWVLQLRHATARVGTRNASLDLYSKCKNDARMGSATVRMSLSAKVRNLI